MATGPAWVGATAEVLATLPSEEWTVLHDVRWPGRRHANVAHVVVGPPGVFVIDAKAWPGRITVHDGVLRQNGHAREMAVERAAEAARAVTAASRSLAPTVARPVLCFARDEQLVASVGGVLVCSTANLTRMLLSRRPVLTPVQRGKIAYELDPARPGPPPWAARPSGAT